MSEKFSLKDDRLGSQSEHLQSAINAAKQKACPVQDHTLSFVGTRLHEWCNSCPNRAPSQAEAEMREALEACVTRLAEFGYDHAVKCVMAILAKYPKGGAT